MSENHPNFENLSDKELQKKIENYEKASQKANRVFEGIDKPDFSQSPFFDIADPAQFDYADNTLRVALVKKALKEKALPALAKLSREANGELSFRQAQNQAKIADLEAKIVQLKQLHEEGYLPNPDAITIAEKRLEEMRASTAKIEKEETLNEFKDIESTTEEIMEPSEPEINITTSLTPAKEIRDEVVKKFDTQETTATEMEKTETGEKAPRKKGAMHDVLDFITDEPHNVTEIAEKVYGQDTPQNRQKVTSIINMSGVEGKIIDRIKVEGERLVRFQYAKEESTPLPTQKNHSDEASQQEEKSTTDTLEQAQPSEQKKEIKLLTAKEGAAVASLVKRYDGIEIVSYTGETITFKVPSEILTECKTVIAKYMETKNSEENDLRSAEQIRKDALETIIAHFENDETALSFVEAHNASLQPLLYWIEKERAYIFELFLHAVNMAGIYDSKMLRPTTIARVVKLENGAINALLQRVEGIKPREIKPGKPTSIAKPEKPTRRKVEPKVTVTSVETKQILETDPIIEGLNAKFAPQQEAVHEEEESVLTSILKDMDVYVPVVAEETEVQSTNEEAGQEQPETATTPVEMTPSVPVEVQTAHTVKVSRLEKMLPNVRELVHSLIEKHTQTNIAGYSSQQLQRAFGISTKDMETIKNTSSIRTERAANGSLVFAPREAIKAALFKSHRNEIGKNMKELEKIIDEELARFESEKK